MSPCSRRRPAGPCSRSECTSSRAPRSRAGASWAAAARRGCGRARLQLLDGCALRQPRDATADAVRLGTLCLLQDELHDIHASVRSPLFAKCGPRATAPCRRRRQSHHVTPSRTPCRMRNQRSLEHGANTPAPSALSRRRSRCAPSPGRNSATPLDDHRTHARPFYASTHAVEPDELLGPSDRDGSHARDPASTSWPGP